MNFCNFPPDYLPQLPVQRMRDSEPLRQAFQTPLGLAVDQSMLTIHWRYTGISYCIQEVLILSRMQTAGVSAHSTQHAPS